MKITVLATLFLGLLALNPAHAGTVDLLSIWSADKGKKTSGGVDEKLGNTPFGDGVIDQFFPDSCTTCAVTTGSIADITSGDFWSTGTAHDQPADMANMLAFEGVVIPGLTGNKDPASFSGQKLLTTADFTMVEQERITKAGAAMLLLKPVDESKLINSLTQVIANSTDAPVSEGAGLLSTVVPIEELRKPLYQSLNKLDEQLKNNENGSLREIVHDLMGLSGLYGMTELRGLVLAFIADYGSLDAEKNLMRVKQIRQHIEDFLST